MVLLLFHILQWQSSLLSSLWLFVKDFLSQSVLTKRQPPVTYCLSWANKITVVIWYCCISLEVHTEAGQQETLRTISSLEEVSFQWVEWRLPVVSIKQFWTRGGSSRRGTGNCRLMLAQDKVCTSYNLLSRSHSLENQKAGWWHNICHL